jgi:ABC-type transport system involved in multi-copper enzyme maturation permease subunit
MFLVDLCALTWRENLKGQILWIGFGAGLLVLLATGVLSGAALSHQDRLLDVSTYFLIDATVFLTALFLGSTLFSRDFCNRGLAEILIPAGVSRSRLYLGRLIGHATMLAPLCFFLFAFRAIPVFLGEGTLKTLTYTSLIMTFFCTFKAILALHVAAFLGITTRPVIALLGSLAFFLFGHFSSGISGVQGLSQDGDYWLSQHLALLYKFFRIWNPNFLLLESWQGAWESPTQWELLQRLGWGAAAIVLFAALGAGLAARQEIGSSKAGG